MDERLRIYDNDGYSIEADTNHDDETIAQRYADNPELDAIFIMIESPFGRQECVALTIAQSETLIEGLQSLVKAVKFGEK